VKLTTHSEVKSVWIYISIPPYVFMAWCLVKHSDDFAFTLIQTYIRGPFAKFMDSPYSKKRPSPHLHRVLTRSNKVNAKSELCGGAVTVSFSNKVNP
jgi:hypothetical protein